jgi:hypothetical protein
MNILFVSEFETNRVRVFLLLGEMEVLLNYWEN